MEIDTETVKKIARLSRIKINELESADIQTDLNRIVEFVKKLSEIDGLGTSDLYSEGYKLVNFWASWCAPCVNEMPALIKLSEKFKDFSFKLVMVNFGENTQKVRDFSKSLSNPSDIYLDQDKLSGNFWVTKGLPVTYLINKKGQTNTKHKRNTTQITNELQTQQMHTKSNKTEQALF